MVKSRRATSSFIVPKALLFERSEERNVETSVIFFCEYTWTRRNLLPIILELEKIKKENTITVGDNENDIPMLKESGLSIGINLTQADNVFATIDKAIDYILSKIDIHN